MHNNIPLGIVVVISMLNQYVFESMECSTDNRVAIAFIYAVLAIFDVYWTVLHCKSDFQVNYPHSGQRWVRYAIIRTLTSLLSMFSFSYFIHKGVPFNCFYEYSRTFANVMFYLSFLIVMTVSYTEHYYWKRLPILIFQVDSDPLTD